MPRVLQLAGGYLPWTIGGKEVYVHELSRHLRDNDWTVRAAFHQNVNHGEPIGMHQREGVDVVVLPPVRGQDRRSAAYSCLPDAIPGFEALLDEFEPDIVHVHDFSVTINRLHLRAARVAGCRLVMTYHSPGQSCLQRSLLYRGRTVCDGEIRANRCTECRLGVSGIPAPVGRALAAVGRFASDGDGQGRVMRALTARAMTDRFIDGWCEMVGLVDRIQVHAEWAARLMERNGARPEQLAMVRLGVPRSAAGRPMRRAAPDGRLRLAYIGRCDEVKGVDVLVRAVKQLPAHLPVHVAFYGPYWDTPYARRLLGEMAGDDRFTRPEVVPNARIPAVLAEADICVVPSIWLETGPLVVLEAFEAGVPVVGSRLGGIAELVRDGVDGLLFSPGDVLGLAAAVRQLVEQPSRLASLRAGLRRPRTMGDLALETATVYRTLLAEHGSPSTRPTPGAGA